MTDGLKIDLTTNIMKIEKQFRQMPSKIILSSARSALAKTKTTLVKETQLEIRRHYKLKPTYIKQKLLTVRKFLSANDINDLAVIVGVKNKKIPLIHFVRGSKTPQSQRGISQGASRRYPKRRRVKIEVRPGRVTTLHRAFLARARGAVNVFRKNPKTRKLIVQTVASAHRKFIKPENRKMIYKKVGPALQRNFVAALRYKLNKLDKK